MTAPVGRVLLVVATLAAVVGVPWLVFPGLDDTNSPLVHHLPLWLLLGTQDSVEAPKALLLYCAVAVAFVAACLVSGAMATSGEQRWVGWGSGALLGWLLLAAATSACPALSFPLCFSLGAFLALGVFWTWMWSPPWEDIAVEGLMWGAVGVAVYGLAQHWQVDPASWNHPELVFGRTISTCGNPNFLAHYEVTVVPWMVARLVRAQGWGTVVRLLALVTVMGSLAVTETRAAVLALLVALVVMLWYLRAAARVQRVVIVMQVFLLLTLGVVAYTVLSRPVDPEETNAATRLYLWKVAGRLVMAHPLLGVGPSMFPYQALAHRDIEPEAIRHRQALAEDPHNAYLSVAASGGLPALGALLVLLVFTARTCHRRSQAADDTATRVRVAAAGAAWAAFWFNALFVYPTEPAGVAALVTIVLLLADSGEGHAPPSRPPLPRALLGISLPLLGVTFVLAGLALHGEFLAKYGDELSDMAGQDADHWETVLTIERDATADVAWWTPTRYQFQLLSAHLLRQWFGATRATAVADRTVQAYTVAMDTNPFDPYPVMELATLEADIGLSVRQQAIIDRALALEGRAIDMDPFNPNFHLERGTLLLQLDQVAAAEQDLQRAQDIYPKDPHTLLALARLWKRKGRLQDARDCATRALQLDRTLPGAAEFIPQLPPPTPHPGR